jgi:hypothetical protein
MDLGWLHAGDTVAFAAFAFQAPKESSTNYVIA